MTNLSAQLRADLDRYFYINRLKIAKKLVSKQDDTVKYLYALQDGEMVETVLMRYQYGHSLCISSQVGCRMGCQFCASTKAGFVRNLSASEMLDQFYQSERESGRRVSNIVLMGIGEPLDNYEELIRFLELITHPEGRNIGYRHITISTCGLVPRIYDLADYARPITLSVSLHAPNDGLRSMTMPINKKYPIHEVLEACRYYVDRTGRRITFEYALISGRNDGVEHAKQLAEQLRSLLCHVNVIPINPIEEQTFRPADSKAVRRFLTILQQEGVSATVRRTLGQDIQAACGQLRRNQTTILSN